MMDLLLLIESQNLLAGSIPGSLADLPDLRQLDLQGNSFTGEIPVKFGEFRRLEWISLAGNLLERKQAISESDPWPTSLPLHLSESDLEVDESGNRNRNLR
ncbi:Receptor-like protein kinase HSL1 [Linum perenne]